MRDRIILVAWSAIFAICGIAADQLAYQSGIDIAEYEKHLEDFRGSDQIFINRANSAAQFRNRYTLDAFFEPAPSESRLSLMESTLQDMKNGTSGLHRLLKVSATLKHLMPRDDQFWFDSNISGYNSWFEDFIQDMASKENWRDKYLHFATYLEVQATVALLSSDSAENEVDRYRLLISREELQRQITLTFAIIASLCSLSFLILYIRAYLVSFTGEAEDSKTVASGRRNKYHRRRRYQRSRKGSLAGTHIKQQANT